MKKVWKVLAWIFAACGLLTYLAAWADLFFGWRIFGVSPEFMFYDAIVAAVFAVFFLLWGKYSQGSAVT